MRTITLLLISALTLLCSNFLQAQSFYSYGGVVTNNTVGNCFNMSVSGVGNLSSTNGLVRVCLSVDQPRPNDLDISLRSPEGIIVSLTTDNGGSSGNDYYYGLCFSDCGPSGPINFGNNFRGVYSPENPLSSFNTGASGDGTWTLCIDDDNASGGDGILNYWSIDFGTRTMPSNPTGETCASAFVLNSLPYSHTCMTLAGSANDYNSCTGMMGGADYVYSYTPTGVGEHLSIDIAQDFSAPSGFPTVVLLDTCPDVAFPANCIQTEIQFNSSENILYITSQPLTQGKTYYIVAASTSGTGGTYDMRIASGLNGNDDCLNATEITNTGEYAGNNYTATEPSIQAPNTTEMACNGSIDNFVFYTFVTDAVGSTVYVNVTDIDCDLTCGGACGIQLALFEEPSGGACLGAGTWGAPVYCESSTETNVYYAWNGLTPNTRYYLMVDGNAGSKCVWNLRAMGDFTQTLLPVDFVAVEVEGLNGENQLTWTVANEVNVDHYEIEHSQSLPEFSSIGLESATGIGGSGMGSGTGNPSGTGSSSGNGTMTSTDNGSHSYQFTHPDPAPGMHYYRIKNVDQDGQVSWSKTVNVWVEEGPERIKVYPNPANDQVTVEVNGLENAEIRLIDLKGRELRRTGIEAGQGLQRIQLEINDLPNGIYFMEVRSPAGNRIVKPFSKQ